MGNQVFQLLSLTEFILLVLSLPYKYVLVQQGKNWNDARTYCQANYIDLAIVEDSNDMAKLKNEAQKQQFTSSAWIGYYNDIYSWRWSLGNQSLGSVRDWCSGEPSYLVEDCAAVNPGCWFDVQCSTPYPFVCFDAKNTGSSSYIVISTLMIFADAQSYCRQHHTDLASITTVEENTIIKGKISGSSWFGLHRDIWMWVDKTKFSAFGWLRGSPWDVRKYDNCGTFVNSLVDAAVCSDILPFYCLRDFTKKQTMRIKIVSNQDVNDPAVKAAILQKIKKKLEEHGISNSTIKWKEQPDGMVFKNIKVQQGEKANQICTNYSF